MWKILGVTGAILLAVLLGVLFGLWGGGTTVVVNSPPAATNDASLAEAVTPAPVWPTNRPRRTVAAPNPGTMRDPGTTAVAIPTAPATNVSTVITNWEDRLDHILASDAEDDVKARQMLAFFPNLPPEGQHEVAQHMVNLTPDADFPALAGVMLDPAADEEIQDIILGDALNRPNTMKLPLLLEVARTPNHPKATEARDILELFLENDYGNDWAQWQTGVQQWLQQNPD